MIHLDREHWQPGWVEPEQAAWLARAVALAEAPCWVIDGQYSSSLPARLERADLIVYIDLSTPACLWGIFARLWRWRGRVRPDMGEGCPEKLDAAFLFYVLNFRRRIRPGVERLLALSSVSVVRLRSVGARSLFFAALSAGGLAGTMALSG